MNYKRLAPCFVFITVTVSCTYYFYNDLATITQHYYKQIRDGVDGFSFQVQAKYKGLFYFPPSFNEYQKELNLSIT